MDRDFRYELYSKLFNKYFKAYSGPLYVCIYAKEAAFKMFTYDS